MRKIDYREFYNGRKKQNNLLIQQYINYSSPTISMFHYERKKLFLEKFKKFKKKIRVLDVGSGEGKIIFSLLKVAKRDDSFLGIDINPNAIMRTKKWVKGNKIKNVDFKRVDISKPNWADSVKGKFDLILFSEVIEHLYPQDQEIALRNIAKKLADGGKLIITCPNRKCLVKKLIKISKKVPFIGKHIKIELKGIEAHVGELSYAQLRGITSKYFEKVRQGGFTFSYGGNIIDNSNFLMLCLITLNAIFSNIFPFWCFDQYIILKKYPKRLG